MTFLKHLSIITRVLAVVTIVLLFYGYLCRIAGLYFFWESRTIGWLLFEVLIIVALTDLIKYKKPRQKNTIPEKIGIGLCVFIIVIQALLFFIPRQTSVYGQIITFIKTSPDIQSQVGTVNGIFMVPVGSIAMSSDSSGTVGQGDLYFVIKGSEKYIDLNLLINKEYDTDWQFVINE